MMEEIKFLHVNDTWELAKLPKGKKVRRMDLQIVLSITEPG